jgi:hypothetical protein
MIKKEIAEVNRELDRLDKKMDEFSEWLINKKKEFEFSEIEEKSFKLNPELKDNIQ